MKRNFDEIDFSGVDMADQMIEAIEKDYGRSVQRIPIFKKTGKDSFDIVCIFSDFKMLKAEIKIVLIYDLPSIVVEGAYY